MMELLVAILIAIGSLTRGEQFTEEFAQSNADAVAKAQQIISDGKYSATFSADGGVVIDHVTM